MNYLSIYPSKCRKNISKLMLMLSSDAETVYQMMKMTASIMNLDVWDNRVVRVILDDCGIENVWGD